jgi:hypothetical protein
MLIQKIMPQSQPSCSKLGVNLVPHAKTPPCSHALKMPCAQSLLPSRPRSLPTWDPLPSSPASSPCAYCPGFLLIRPQTSIFLRVFFRGTKAVKGNAGSGTKQGGTAADEGMERKHHVYGTPHQKGMEPSLHLSVQSSTIRTAPVRCSRCPPKR